MSLFLGSGYQKKTFFSGAEGPTPHAPLPSYAPGSHVVKQELTMPSTNSEIFVNLLPYYYNVISYVIS